MVYVIEDDDYEAIQGALDNARLRAVHYSPIDDRIGFIDEAIDLLKKSAKRS